MSEKKKILILNGQYAPGYKGGGPIQSCINLVENLYTQFDFYVLCADRDYRGNSAYSNIIINDWNQVGHAKVFYASPSMQTFVGFRKIIQSMNFDILYLNGFFSPIFTIKPLIIRRLGMLNNIQVILTPRGDFTGGCENKKIKKYTYIYMTKLLGMYRKLVWHTTSELEDSDIKKIYPNAQSFIVPNLPAPFELKPLTIKKNKGELRLVFLSRIFPKKNLKYALEVLGDIKEGEIIFDIYGPMEDPLYWNECEKIICNLPSSIEVSYKGEVEHNLIPGIFQNYHAFFFPTLGENYGHVIVEAMMNNCLCILSKGVTPWDDYIDLLGLGDHLSNREQFSSILSRLINVDNFEFEEMINTNNLYIREKVDAKPLIDNYTSMFDICDKNE